MNRLLLFIIVTFSFFFSFAQNGNEWIDYSQKYLSFKVYETGWHRLDYSDVQPALFNLGIDVSTISSDQLQVFGREKEQAILVEDGGDGTFDSGDYIAFWGEKNDGWKDSLLFNDPSKEMPDSYYSYVNDTIRYFLSVSAIPNGKRIIQETDTNIGGYPTADYCWVKRYYRFVTSNYNYGPLYYNQSSPTYGEGEGWTGNPIKAHNSTTTTNNNFKIDCDINTKNAFIGTNAPSAKISSSISSASDPSVSGPYNHRFMMQYGSSMTKIVDSSFAGYKLIKSSVEIPSSSLINGSTKVRHRGVNVGGGVIQGQSERLTLSSVTIEYPHTFDFEGASAFKFSLGNNTLSSKQVLSITNFSGIVPKLIIINDNDFKSIPLIPNGLAFDAVVPNNSSNDSIELILFDESSFINVNSFDQVNGSGVFTDFSSIDPNEAMLIITHSSLMNAANDYSNYRSSIPGGSHNVVLTDIDELYDQFGGGIEKHPVSIRYFVKYVSEIWSSKPEHLFIIGKSISNRANGIEGGSRESEMSFQKNLVPTWGYPGSDNHITQGINNSGKSYGIATGRLTTTSEQEVLEYLDKIIEYESHQDPNSLYDIESKEWQKNALLLGGGDDNLTMNVIRAYFDIYSDKLSDTALGAMMHEYHRDPFETALDLETFYNVQALLDEGLSIINFYGHSSAGGGFGLNINSPENWNNEGKYPVVVGLGCYTGDVHNYDDNVYAIQLVNVPDEGAICLISTVTQGFLTNVGYYTELFYSNLSSLNYGETVGSHMKHTCDSIYSLQGSAYWGIVNESNYTGMAMQGDPTLKCNWHQRPELVLDEERIWTVPARLDLSVDTFDLYVVSTNIGRAFIGEHDISVERISPAGLDTIIIQPLASSFNRDTIVFRFPTNHSTASGLNYFNINIDLPNSIIEEQQDELSNNHITYSTYVSSNGLQPIWPYEYMIIPYDTITLKASTLDPFEIEKNYIIELDTTSRFNSPFKKHQKFSSIGGVVEAFPNMWITTSGAKDSLVFTDSTVYYWRCALDTNNKEWLESSFQYIPDTWGWGQSHFLQFEKDYFQGILFDTLDRTFNFQDHFSTIEIIMHTNLGNWATSTFQNTAVGLNGNNLDYGGPDPFPAILVAVIDPCTLGNWKTPHLDSDGIIHNEENCFGQFNGDPDVCPGTNLMGRDREQGIFAFRYGDTEEMDSLATFLENKIPEGFYVVAYTFIPDSYTNPSSLYGAMPNELITAFQNLGTSNISNNQPDDGWIVFAQKGFPANTIELHTADTIASGQSFPSQTISYFDTIQGCEVGYITSEIVGPAFEWNKLVWQQSPYETFNADSTQLKIYGITYHQNKTLLIDTVLNDLDSILQLNNLIDASVFPMLQLEAKFHDTIAFTPGQLKRWQVIYSPVPELAINPKKGFHLKSNEYQEGDSVEFAVAIENVSDFHADSVLVSYYNLSSYGNRTAITYPKQDSLRKYEILFDTLKYSSENLSNLNYIWINANPYVTQNIQDQPEQFYFNNLAERSFNITEDKINPILDVTFDGVHIINEDIVSAEPAILITLDDENPFLLMNDIRDTSLFDIYLKEPETNSFKQIYFMNGPNENLHWEPATDEKNKFKIEYNPSFTEDGIYTLKVQGKDKSNNSSGDYSYEIDFEVITYSSITHLYNYPNPFSTSTQFVFTLTGSKLPDELQIQIMTVTGKVVKEIDLMDLGELRIGNNVTSYAWDGRDMFGDQLANGVYLYRVIAKIEGEIIDHRTTSADEKSFHKGFGKMYLLR